MALVPLVWLGGLHWRGHRRGTEWWWLAGVFAVSWFADTAAHWVNPDLVGNVYPVSQAALVGFVFLTRRDAMRLLAVLLVVGLLAVLWRGPLGVDVMLRTVAWGAVAGIVYDRPIGRLRIALLVAFGLGLVTWYGYALWPGWWSYGVYQATRAGGIALFCWAAMRPGPSLTVDHS